MKEGLALLVFFLSLVGLVLLQPSTAPLSEVKEVGKAYKTCGVLFPLKELERGCIYRISDGEVTIKAVQFFGECVSGYACVYGRLDLYRGEKEIVILGFG